MTFAINTSCRFSFLLLFCITAQLDGLAAPRVTISPAPDWILPVKPGGHSTNIRDISDGYYLSLIDVQHHVDKQAVYFRLVREIVSAAGVQNGSELSISLNSAFEQLTVHQVIKYRNGKPQNLLRPDGFRLVPVEDDRERFLYNGTYTASMLLADVRPGDRIEYAYTITGRNPVFGGRYASEFYFAAGDPLPHYHRALITGSARKLAFLEVNNPPKKTVTQRNGLTIYEWDAFDLKPIRPEEYEPGWNDTAPHVQVSEYGSWKGVTDWALPLYTFPAPSEMMLAKVAEWKRLAGKNVARYAQLAVAFVQDDIRYMGIEIGEHSHRPHAPDQTMRQRYGDCKDKSLLLCALLRANSITAYPALIHSYTGAFTTNQLPSPNAFNHLIVYAELNGKPVWVDPTMAYQRSRAPDFYIPPYGSALIVRPGENKLSTLGPLDAGQLTVKETFSLPSPNNPNEAGLLIVESIYTRNHADGVRGDFAGRGVAALEKSYLTFYQDSYRDQVISLKTPVYYQDDTITNTLTVKESYALNNVWQRDSTSKEMTFFVLGKSLYNMLIRLPATARLQPVGLTYPYHMDYTIAVRLPEPWNLSVKEWTVDRNAYSMAVDQTFSASDSTLTLHYVYRAKQDFIPVKDIEQYRADVDKLIGDLEYGISYKPDLAGSDEALNYWAIFLAVITLGIGGWLGLRLYRYDPPMLEQVSWAGPGVGPWFRNTPIGGWLVLLTLGIVFAPFRQVYNFAVQSEYLNARVWNVMQANDGDGFPVWQLMCGFELIFQLLFLCGTLVGVVLFFERRRSFPLVYSAVIILSILYLSIDTVLAAVLSETEISTTDWTEMVKSVLSAMIWVPYLYYSERSGKTFVHRYEKESEPAESVIQ